MRKPIMRFMKSIGHLNVLTLGQWGSCTDLINETTQARIVNAIERGAKRIHIGNTTAKNCEYLSRINSRHHGKQIRTVTAYF